MGLNIVIAKAGTTDFPPFLFAFLQFSFSVPFIFIIPKPKIKWKHLIGLSLCWGILYHGPINYALTTGIAAGSVVLILQISSLFSVCFAALHFKEMARFQEIIGIFICLMGIFCITWDAGLSANLIGFISLFIAGICFSLGTILSKIIKADPLALIIWVSALSIIPSLLISIIFENNLSDIFIHARIESWAIAFLGSWGSAFLGSSIWIYIVKKYPISKTSPFQIFNSRSWLFFSILLLSETYPILSWIGAGITLLGLGISQVKFNLNQLTMEKSN